MKRLLIPLQSQLQIQVIFLDKHLNLISKINLENVQDVSLLEMDFVMMLLMMEDVILMEAIVVFETKILNTVSSALAMLISQKVNMKMTKEMNDHLSMYLSFHF